MDHVLLATGYRVDIAKYKFLAPELVQEVRQLDGYPDVTAGFATSVPGLHFIGCYVDPQVRPTDVFLLPALISHRGSSHPGFAAMGTEVQVDENMQSVAHVEEKYEVGAIAGVNSNDASGRSCCRRRPPWVRRGSQLRSPWNPRVRGR